MGCQSWGGMDGLSIMGKYRWAGNHGEVWMVCQSWGGTAGLSVMGGMVGLAIMGRYG